MNSHHEALISLLLATFPVFQSGDPESALEALRIVMAQADERDVQPGVMTLIGGELPGQDPRFAPTAAQVSQAIRIARDKRLESERRNTLTLPPPPPMEITPAERARVKAKFEGLVAGLAEQKRTEDAAKEARYRDLLRKTDDLLGPDMSPEAVRARLNPHKPYYSVGDEDVA